MGELLRENFSPPRADELLGDDTKNRTDDREADDVHSSMTSVPDSYEPSALSEISVVQDEVDAFIGVMIGGKYRIDRKIGQGGMGIVYLGINDDLGQKVAIKFLSRKFVDDEGIVQRFLNEARSYCRVNHPNAVTLLEYGQYEDGTLYIITEFIEGMNLSETMKEKGPLEFTTVLAIALQLCEVLSAAHIQGVIHRDLKPDNLMLIPTSRGRYAVKVLDFGIAKIVDDDEFDGPTTETGSVFGTPEFMSPEQARGEGADQRSDIYAVGVILYYMLTGKLPFRGKNKLVVLNKQLNEKPKRPTKIRPEVPVKFEAIVLKCLNKGRESRYDTADDLMEALEELQLNPSTQHITGKVGLTEASEVAPETPESIRLQTVRLGGWDDTQDAHAETLAQTLTTDSPPADLESIELWREQPTSETSGFQRTSGHGRAIAGLVAVGVIIAGVVWALSSREPALEPDISQVLVTGQVLGLLTAVENMVRDGNLDGAAKSIDQTRLWMTDEELTPQAATRRQELQTMVSGLLNARENLYLAADKRSCEEATRLHIELTEASTSIGESLRGELQRACAEDAPVPVAPTPAAVKPKPEHVEPSKEEVVVPVEDLPADPQIEKPATEVDAGSGAALPDGMALPPKLID